MTKVTEDLVKEVDTPMTCCSAPESVQLLPEDVAERLATAFKAIGHPIRLQMMHILSQAGGTVCVCDIESQFAIKQPTVSHHLRALRESGLIDAEQRGLFAYYRIRPEMMTFLRRHLQGMTG